MKSIEELKIKEGVACHLGHSIIKQTEQKKRRGYTVKERICSKM